MPCHNCGRPARSADCYRCRHTYRATLGGSGWSRGPVHDFPTITAARRWAEAYGGTADWCAIADLCGNTVAEHRRDPNGDGMNWYRAMP